ncbi:hypothetical protein [Liquorilactobacillus capillatus]|nr:hypothetical protein [Liquorilactobacillus capillatus]
MKILWSRYRNTGLIGIFFILLSFIFIFPLSRQGIIYNGDDLYYHVLRINELAQNIQHGNLFPAINTYTFKQIGYPVNLFYPWVTLLPFGVFRVLISNQVTAIYAGFFFYTFVTLWITYIVGKRFSNSRLQAAIMAGIYVFSAYHVTDAFTRFALGEYLAMSFVPLCFYGFYAIMYGDRRDWPFLAVGGMMVVLSHVLSAIIIVTFLLFVWIISLYWVDNRLKRTLTLAFSGIVAFLGSSIFILPFLEQELFQKFKQPSPQPLVPDDFNNMLSASFSNNLNRVLDGNHYNIGFLLICSVLLGVVVFNKFDVKYRLIYLVGVGSFLVTSNLFPWNLVQNSALNIIQFPFRLLIIPTFLLSIVASKIILLVADNYGGVAGDVRKRSIIVLLTFLLLGALPYLASMYKFTQGKTANTHIYTPDTTTKLAEEQNLYLDQYTPAKGLPSLNDVKNHIAIINGKKVQIKKIFSAPNTLTFNDSIIKRASSIDLPIFYYKNLQVYRNGKQIVAKKSTRGTVKVISAVKGPVTVKYIFSKLDKLGIIISLLTWGTLIVYGIFIKSRKQRF